jgi:hypothetical protein
MPPEDVSRFWLAGRRALWNEVGLVGFVSGRKTDERTFTVDVLDPNSRTMWFAYSSPDSPKYDHSPKEKPPANRPRAGATSHAIRVN